MKNFRFSKHEKTFRKNVEKLQSSKKIQRHFYDSEKNLGKISEKFLESEKTFKKNSFQNFY